MAELIVAELAGKAAAFIVGPSAAAPIFRLDPPTNKWPSKADGPRHRPPRSRTPVGSRRQVDPALATTESFLREMLRLRTVRT